MNSEGFKGTTWIVICFLTLIVGALVTYIVLDKNHSKEVKELNDKISNLEKVGGKIEDVSGLKIKEGLVCNTKEDSTSETINFSGKKIKVDCKKEESITIENSEGKKVIEEENMSNIIYIKNNKIVVYSNGGGYAEYKVYDQDFNVIFETSGNYQEFNVDGDILTYYTLACDYEFKKPLTYEGMGVIVQSEYNLKTGVDKTIKAMEQQAGGGC